MVALSGARLFKRIEAAAFYSLDTPIAAKRHRSAAAGAE
jgi:hypothetical protein